MPEPAAPPPMLPSHEFCSGRLALDFCNTVSTDGRDRLADPAGLSGWAERAGWPLTGTVGAAELAGFRSLRGRLRNLVAAAIDHRSPAPEDIEALDGAMIDAFSALRLAPGQDRPLAWQDAAQPADKLRHGIARDAVDLLTAGDPARLRRCTGEDCGWFFYDSSKNGTRRWCVMEDCGTRDKVRRFRARQAGSRQIGSPRAGSRQAGF